MDGSYTNNQARQRKSSSVSSVSSVLDSVRNLKSWGCNFFTPLTTKQPTYFYYKHETAVKTNNEARKKLRRGILKLHALSIDDLQSDSFDESDTSTSDESDVFDAGRDYGMSLLNEGNCLLEKRQKPGKHSEKDSISESPKPTKKTILKPSAKRAGASSRRQSFKTRQKRISTSSSNVAAGVLLTSTESHQDREAGKTSQVTFAKSPEKQQLSASQDDLCQDSLDGGKTSVITPSLKRAMSSDSNLYKSAESSLSSSGSVEDFFSAESDVEDETPAQAPLEVVQEPTLVKRHSLPRPGSLILDTNTTSSEPDKVKLVSPLSEQVSSATPITPDLPSPHFIPSNEPQTHDSSKEHLLKCYESYLTSLSMTEKEKRVFTSDEEFLDFLEAINFELPHLEVSYNGIHPSVVLDSQREASRVTVRRDHMMAHRELSFTNNPIVDGCTTVSVHMKVKFNFHLHSYIMMLNYR